MIPHKFNGKLALLALLGLILFFGSAQIASFEKDTSMQPELATPLVSKEQAKEIARAFLLLDNPTLIVSESNVIYASKKTLSAYLQKNNLTKAYKAEFAKAYPLDFWTVQIWDELAQTRYIVNVSMAESNVIEWSAENISKLLDQEKVDTASTSNAQELAKQYLQKQGFDLVGYKAMPTSYKNNAFASEFEKIKLSIGNAKQKLKVQVANNKVIAFSVNFTVPEADATWINKQEGYGQFMSLISLAFMLIFAITAIVISIVKRKLISFSRGWFLTLLFLAINVVSVFNFLPSSGMDLGETNATAYLITYLIFTIGANCLFAAAVYFTLITGVQMWKERGWNPWPRWKEARFGADVFYGMGRGYLICLFVIGVQQALFLFIGKTFHSFAINDPGQSEYNMLWPILFPTMAWMAAISEEIIFRLFGIILMQKLLKLRFLAILIPSIIWALAHTSYSLYPSYTRLIEVTVLGFIFSLTFLRYGLITAIFTHAIMDSLLMGLSLLSTADHSSYTLLGLFYIVFPALLAYSIRFFKRRSPTLKAADPAV
jgi:membrane protease YdiL (CAAX protease family)